MPRENRRVVWSPRSKKDLREVWRYYERVASPEIADKLLREIDDAGRRLADEAMMWRARDERSYRDCDRFSFTPIQSSIALTSERSRSCASCTSAETLPTYSRKGELD